MVVQQPCSFLLPPIMAQPWIELDDDMILEDIMIPPISPEATHLLSFKPSTEDDMIAVPVLQSETDTWLLEPDLSRRQFWPSESAICQLTGRLSSGSPTASQTDGVVHVAEELLNGCGLIHVLPVSSLHGCSSSVANRGCSSRVANPGCSSVEKPSCSLKPLPASEGSSVLLRQSAESTAHVDLHDAPDDHDTCDGTADGHDTCDNTADEHDTCHDTAEEPDTCDGTVDEHDTCESSEEQQTPGTLEASTEQQQQQQHQQQHQQHHEQQQSASVPTAESPQSSGSGRQAIRSPSCPLTMSLRSRAKGNSGDSPPGALLSTPVASDSIPRGSVPSNSIPRDPISRDSTPRKRIRSPEFPYLGEAVEKRAVRRLRVLVSGDPAERTSQHQLDVEETGIEAVTDRRKRGSRRVRKAGSLKEINQYLLSPIPRRQVDFEKASLEADTVAESRKRGSTRSGRARSLKEIDVDLTSPVFKRQSLNPSASRRSVRIKNSKLRYAEDEEEDEEEELQVAAEGVKKVDSYVSQGNRQDAALKVKGMKIEQGIKQQQPDVDVQQEELQDAAVHVKQEVIQEVALKIKQEVLQGDVAGEAAAAAAAAAGKENVDPVSAEQVLGMAGRRSVLQKRKQSFKNEARSCHGQKRHLKPEAAEKKIGLNQKREGKKTKRGLPLEAVAVLRRWIDENPHRLFLDASEKADLTLKTGLTRLQVENWFCYARRRGYMARAGDSEQSDSFPAEE